MRSTSKKGPRAFVLAVLLGGASFFALPSDSQTGGPDLYGYVWVDSRGPSPIVPYSWFDITTSGSQVVLAPDDCSFEISLGFQFRFYGILVDQVLVCSDGFISFSLQGLQASPGFPDPMKPNDRIVGLGMDLYPLTNGPDGLYILSQPSTTPKRFIVTWQNAYTQYTTDQQTFQIVLEQNQTSRDGRIIVQYQSLRSASAALIGIEDQTGSSGLAYPFPPANGLAVAFLPPTDAGLPPDLLTVVPSILAPGSVTQGTPNVPMLQLDLSTPANDILVSEIEIDLSGLGAGPEDITLAALWVDDDGDGLFSPSFDMLLRTAIMGGSPTSARFSLLPSLTVSISLARRVYVSYDISPAAGIGDWIGARISASNSISVQFPDLVAANGFPVDTYSADVRTRIDPSVDVLALLSSTDRVPQNGTQWETDLPAMSLSFRALTNLVELEGITVGVGGNATAGDVWRVKALEDLDHDGAYTPGRDRVLAVATPLGVPLAATLGFSRTIAGTTEDLLILFDIGPEATLGNVANFTLNVTGVHLATGSSDLLSPSNFPVATGNVTIGPGPRPELFPAWSGNPPSADGIWGPSEYILGQTDTDVLDPPAGNQIAGFVTVENNRSMLFVGIDATGDGTSSTEDGVAIGFDTDANGSPTNGSDDVFTANATGGARFLYNDTAGTWILNATCAATGGDETTPACASGFGATDLSSLDHRFYEFAIPLALLGVPVPVGAGTVLRFAIAAPPHDGLQSESGRSTWPILFDPLPSLRHFADLHLVSAPPPNSPPTLNWTAEPGYLSDGLEPETGPQDLEFLWRVVYADVDEDPPAVSQPRLRVLFDGVPITGSPFVMTEDNASDTVYSDGKVYQQRVRLSVCEGNFTYEFTARDGKGDAATPMQGSGPLVSCPNLPPLLSFPQVAPAVGFAGTAFTFRIAYADPENRSAEFVEATVDFNGTDLPTIPLSWADWVGTPSDFTQGAWYEGSAILSQVGTNYRYRFRTSDWDTTTDAGPFFGPQVLSLPPDILEVSGADLAPIIADEGTELVEFLQVVLFTSDPEINVTSLRFDQIGNSDGSEVQEVLLYDDLDGSGLDPGDLLLGSEPVLLHFVAFEGVDLRVTPSNVSILLLVANLTTPGAADRTIGFELSSAASITVGPGDTVAPATARSTRTLVNVRPRASAITLDGWPAGSPQSQHIVRSAPLIGWRFEDNNSADIVQKGYNVSIRSIAPEALLWSFSEMTATSSVLYQGPALAPGQSYRAEIRVFDGRLWSGVWATVLRRNTPPAPPILLDPLDETPDIPTTATLSWAVQTDAEGDTIRFYSWVSDNPGFTPSIANTTFSTTVTVALAEGTEYFWKVGASDGYEFTNGNATVWRFTTRSSPSPVLGVVFGRVVNGTSSLPIPGAFVELLNGTGVVDARVTAGDGAFHFGNLALAHYTIRVSAFGFLAQSRPAEPSSTSPSVNLGDIVLSVGDSNGPPETPVNLPWLPLLLALVLAFGILIGFASRRRHRREEAPDEESGPSGGGARSARPTQPSYVPSSRVPDQRPGGIRASTAEVQFECPICGRKVAGDATRCECGAIFED